MTLNFKHALTAVALTACLSVTAFGDESNKKNLIPPQTNRILQQDLDSTFSVASNLSVVLAGATRTLSKGVSLEARVLGVPALDKKTGTFLTITITCMGNQQDCEAASLHLQDHGCACMSLASGGTSCEC
jgi:hypothetical protein